MGTFVVLGVRVGLLPVAARIPPEGGQSLREACRRLICCERSLKVFDVHRSVDFRSGGVPFWNKGFAWGSLLGGIPPMFFKECASCVECLACKSTENGSVEVIDTAGDARRVYSNWGSYFIEEYSVKVTWLLIVILG